MKQRGFAILVVLFGLSIVTALYAISSTLTISAVKRNSVDLRLAVEASERFGLLEASLPFLPSDDAVATIVLGDTSFLMQDVTGMIDLNTASRPLLDAFFEAAEFSAEEYRRFIDWRASGQRLQRAEDLWRITQRTPSFPDLHRIITVHSGSVGVSDVAVTRALSELMGWPPSVPEAFQAPPREAVFAIFEGETGRYAGTVALAQDVRVVLDVR